MKNTKKGFTLIELLVVVLIIGILASVGIPSYFKTVETAKANDAVAMTSMIGNAYRMFLVDNPGAFMNGTIANGCNPPATCAGLGATDVCRLVACNYVAPQDWGNNAYSFTVGGAAACTSDRNGGTYDGWGYSFDMLGRCTANGNAPSCPRM